MVHQRYLRAFPSTNVFLSVMTLNLAVFDIWRQIFARFCQVHPCSNMSILSWWWKSTVFCIALNSGTLFLMIYQPKKLFEVTHSFSLPRADQVVKFFSSIQKWSTFLMIPWCFLGRHTNVLKKKVWIMFFQWLLFPSLLSMAYYGKSWELLKFTGLSNFSLKKQFLFSEILYAFRIASKFEVPPGTFKNPATEHL